MATTTVKSTGLTAAQTSQLQSIVNSNPAAAQAYSTGKAPTSSASPTNPKDAPGYVAGSSPTDSASSRAAYAMGTNAPTTPITPVAPAPTTPIDTSQPSPQNTSSSLSVLGRPSS